jgi:4-diphosphocytidyl-2-C-methyl-D-erythritol kinase
VKLVALAPGKVNLCLLLGPPSRADGRHELVTLIESVSLADELTMETDVERDEVVCSGVEGPNLVSAAINGLRARGWDGPRVRIEIVKRIPVAAGMGGGSADAAAAFRLASELAPGRPEEIIDLAASLGADVPSQVAPGVSLGRGAGDVVEPIPPLGPHAFVVVPQPVALSTADVYREADRLGLPRQPDDLDQFAADLELILDQMTLDRTSPLAERFLINDLEAAAVSLCPVIAEALDEVTAVGAEHALVCGSGPTVAGLWWGADAADRAASAADLLAARFPGTVAVSPVGAEFGLPRFA